MGNITITVPGPLTTVQDMGRYGNRATGFTSSGVCDKHAAAAANILCGNDINAAVLEMTLMGVTCTFDSECLIALTGADMTPKLNGEAIECCRAVAVKGGDTLALGFAVKGCRGYLAVSGGIDVPEVMGSRSTALKYGVGGHEGRKLKAGDVLPYAEHPKLAKILAKYDKRITDKSEFGSPAIVYAVYGPQDDMFTDAAKQAFESSEYTVTPDSDRMGIRLDGTPLETVNGSDIISDGIVPGCIQVPKTGLPIILGADCQTTGGYAKIAAVCTFSLPTIAQLKPGEKLRFKVLTIEEAQKMSIKYEKEIQKLAKKMRV